MNQEGMLKPALIGGVLLGVLSALPGLNLVNCLCCAWVIAGGVLAANLYVNASALPVTLGQGAILGLLTGVIGAVTQTVLSIPIHFVLAGFGMGVAEQLRDVLNQVGNLPQESRDTLMALMGEGILGAVFFITAVVNLVIYGLVAMLGGTIGVALFEKRRPGEAPVAPPPVQRPPDWPPPPPGDFPRE